MERDYSFEIMKEIKERWSPRAISEEKIAETELYALFEAARYAPSCFNEQPWRFIFATEKEELEILRGILAPKNQLWANKAPVLVLILAEKNFRANGKPNRWNQFDTGAAWGFLMLEAQSRGLAVHGMGGFDSEAARHAFKIPDDFDIMAVAAIGRHGKIEELAPEFRQIEKPGTRDALNKTVFSVKQFIGE